MVSPSQTIDSFDTKKLVAAAFASYTLQLTTLLKSLDQTELRNFTAMIWQACKTNRTIFVIGNGENAAIASLWCSNLSKEVFYRTGKRIKCLALTDNQSWITAIANEISFSEVFSDQLRALAEPEDVLLCLSTFGNSPNLLSAIGTAHDLGLQTISIVGFEGGQVAKLSHAKLQIPAKDNAYSLVADVELVLNHFLCHYLSEKLIAAD